MPGDSSGLKPGFEQGDSGTSAEERRVKPLWELVPGTPSCPHPQPCASQIIYPARNTRRKITNRICALVGFWGDLAGGVLGGSAVWAANWGEVILGGRPSMELAVCPCIMHNASHYAINK